MQTPVNLNSLLRLRHLEIVWNLDAANLQHCDRLLYIARTLKTLPFGELRPQQLQLDLFLSFYGLPNFEADLHHLPWSSLIELFEDARSSERFSEVKLKIARLERHGHKRVPVDMTTPELTEILDANKRLKKLRETGLLSYIPNQIVPELVRPLVRTCGAFRLFASPFKTAH